jgi:circadian clock protein KaiC
MTHEITELYGATSLTEYGASHLADNVVMLQYRSGEDNTVSRTLSVLKTRASSHDPRIRAFEITPTGITLDGHPR